MAQESAYFTLEDISGKHDVKRLKRGLDALPGVTSVSVSAEADRLAVDYDTTGIQREALVAQIQALGFNIR